MSNVTSHLFVPASKKKNLEKSASLVAESDAVRIIDLEDSVKDATNASRSADLKQKARATLKNYLPNDNEPFQVRINDLQSPFWEDDLQLLDKLQEEVRFDERCGGIVLAKTNSREQVQKLSDILSENGIDVPIIPLIETTSGMENLEDIIESQSVRSAMFGHHDYFYDEGVFPIPRSALTSEKYRSTMKSMLETIDESDRDVGFIDGIHPYLYDEKGMQDACRYLHQQAEELQLGKLALNPTQVDAIESTDEWSKEIEVTSEDEELSAERKREIAEMFVDAYEGRDTEDLGVGRKQDRYMSPQQYYMAKDFLKENDEKDQEINSSFGFE